MKIKIVHEQHYIEGDRYKVFLIQGEQLVCLIANVKTDKYLDMCEAINGIKFRLEQLGNDVEIVNKIEPDPNFNTEFDAMEYLETKGE